MAVVTTLALTSCVSEAPSGTSDHADTAHAASANSEDARRQVLIISIDGLSSGALTRLGRRGTPHLHRMMRQGACTLNARTEVEQTETLPNHIGMVTGRRIDAARGGHGVTWNDDRTQPATVQEAAGHGVDSIYSMAERHGLDGALYSAKAKFRLLRRSWPAGVDRAVIRDKRNRAVVSAARRDLRSGGYDLALLHISLPDMAGHDQGWMTAPYLQAVRRSDRLVGSVLTTVSDSPRLARDITVLVTSDHGGPPGSRGHADAHRRSNFRIPFLMWGRGVSRGADLYDLSPELADPGTDRVGYEGPQPVRNGFVANAAAELLGLPVVHGSELNAASELTWKAP